MIILTAHATVEGKYPAVPPKRIMQWPNDVKLGFNIGNPAEWFFFLRRLKIDGHPLPFTTKDGSPLVFRVYIWGGIKGMPRGGGTPTIFPGRGPNGEPRPLVKFGRLDKNEKFWQGQ